MIGKLSTSARVIDIFFWPGNKLIESSLYKRLIPGGGPVAAIFIHIPIYLASVVVFWGLAIAVVGNLISYGITGHF